MGNWKDDLEDLEEQRKIDSLVADTLRIAHNAEETKINAKQRAETIIAFIQSKINFMEKEITNKINTEIQEEPKSWLAAQGSHLNVMELARDMQKFANTIGRIYKNNEIEINIFKNIEDLKKNDEESED